MTKKIFLIGIINLSLGHVSVGQSSRAAITYGNNSSAGHWVSTRGFHMYYETYGRGRPLLLIHGNGGSIASMAGQIPYFSASYKVIAADCRAQGKSVDPGDSLGYSMMADDWNALLDSLHLDSCNVIGWSDGAIDGLLLAIRHPDKVHMLAVTGANLTPDSTALEPEAFLGILKDLKDDQAQVQTSTIRNDIKLQQLMLDHPHITASMLGKIRCPALVIGGDHDLIRPEHTVLIFRGIPHAYLWILPHSGHGTLVEHRDLFNQTVSRFFSNSLE
jgi:pimeloyl-ACP methyl ester carboxylesterase